jgi:hypothetical protein
MTKRKRERLAKEKFGAPINITPWNNDTIDLPAVNFTLEGQPLQIEFNHSRRNEIISGLEQVFNLTLNTSSNLSRILIYTLQCFYGYELVTQTNDEQDREWEPAFDSLELNSFGDWSATSAFINFSAALNQSCFEPDPDPYWTDTRIWLTEIFVVIAVVAVVGLCVFKACCIQPEYGQGALANRLKNMERCKALREKFFLDPQELDVFKENILKIPGEEHRTVLESKLKHYINYTNSKCIVTEVPVTQLTHPVTVLINFKNSTTRSTTFIADAKALALKIQNGGFEPKFEFVNAPSVPMLAKKQVTYVAGHDADIIKFIEVVRKGTYKNKITYNKPTPIKTSRIVAETVSDKPSSLFSCLNAARKKKLTAQTSLTEISIRRNGYGTGIN